LINLKEGLKQFNVSVGMLYLGDCFIKSPSLLKALDIPLIRNEFERYDVIHAGASPACYVMGLAKRLGHYALVQDVHGCIEELFLLRGTFNFRREFSYLQELILQEISNRTSDLFITCSKPLKDRLLQKGVDEAIVEVIYNSVDTEVFRPKDCTSQGKEFVVTYAGSFQEWQGIANLLEAAQMTPDADLKFRIIGFRNRDKMLKTAIKDLLGDRVELVDSLGQAELVNQLCSSDVLVIPRNRSVATQMAFPTKFAEYLAVGKPIIMTNVDETSSFIGAYGCGFVCEPSAEAIAQTIIKAKSLPRDVLVRMGQNGRQLAELKFDRKVIGKQYYEFLEDKLSERAC
jgi:glycosyltransferase involved in cell wall biosynthesis